MITKNERAEFLGQLIDEVEDFLEERGITLPNPEIAEDAEDSAAIIYGSDYDEMQQRFASVGEAWDVLERDE